MTKKQVSKLDPAKIHIVDTRVLNGQIDAPFEFHITKVKGHNYQLGFELSFNLEDKNALAQLRVQVTTESEEKVAKEATGAFLIAFVYHIENLDELVKQTKKEGLSIDGALGNALASITYSTTRGILMTRFNGTALQNTVMPVISPNDLLEMPLNPKHNA
jgi:hypothetical protein